MKYDGLAILVQTLEELAQQAYGSAKNVKQTETMGESPLAAPLKLDEQVFLERHHAIIVKKLEEKMHELEMYAETLSRKNREIQSSEARYRNLFEHASIGIFALNKNDGKVFDVNAEGLALLGYTAMNWLTSNHSASWKKTKHGWQFCRAAGFSRRRLHFGAVTVLSSMLSLVQGLCRSRIVRAF